MVDAFAQTAFALKPYQMSDVVQTQFGYHLILATDRKPGKDVKFEDVKEESERSFFHERLRDLMSSRLRPRAKNHHQPDSQELDLWQDGHSCPSMEKLPMRLGMLAKTIVLLICSNAFHERGLVWASQISRAWLPGVILVSWLIALPEYALQVPANRIGAAQFSPTQLKIIQEVISVSVFVVFAWIYFREMPTWRTVLAFALIVGARCFLVQPSGANPPNAEGAQPRWIAYPRETRYNRSSSIVPKVSAHQGFLMNKKGSAKRFAMSRVRPGKWFWNELKRAGIFKGQSGPWKPTSVGAKMQRWRSNSSKRPSCLLRRSTTSACSCKPPFTPRDVLAAGRYFFLTSENQKSPRSRTPRWA